jgi:hypothetical protein
MMVATTTMARVFSELEVLALADESGYDQVASSKCEPR